MSAQTPDVYIHIGMHKAVSSFLQEGSFDLLAKQRAMLYIDCYFNRGLEEVNAEPFIHEMHDKFQRTPYFMIPEDYRDKVETGLAALIQKHRIASNKVLISNEYLVGEQDHNFLLDVNPILAIRRMFRNPRIILVIRKQDDWLESWYSDMVRSGRWNHIRQVLNYYDGELGNYKPCYRLNVDAKQVDWHLLTLHLENLFGPENVLVVPMELIKSDPKRLVDSITGFMGIPYVAPAQVGRVNPKLPFVTLWLTRHINRFINNGFNSLVLLPQQPLNIFLRKWAFRPYYERPAWVRKIFPWNLRMKYVNLLTPLGWLIPLKRNFISAEIRAKIMAHHRVNNELLDKHRNLGLKAFKYY